MPAYKTIVLELLQDRPMLHEQLRANGTLVESMEQLAVAFRACHLQRMKELEAAMPGSDPSQLSSEAMELALSELEASLPPVSRESDDGMETLSLDQAILFLQRHMPAG
ncbi:MAG TPA: hypothetical protein VHA37_03260 [Candidatus Saccharimonadales bacterium]|nr:hypothetical protein [Candidatus Saccharimonadales bacterium]